MGDVQQRQCFEPVAIRWAECGRLMRAVGEAGWSAASVVRDVEEPGVGRREVEADGRMANARTLDEGMHSGVAGLRTGLEAKWEQDTRSHLEEADIRVAKDMPPPGLEAGVVGTGSQASVHDRWVSSWWAR